MSQCHLCPLNQAPYDPGKAVPGLGHLDAKLMIVGEAPGYWESQRGLPFVGPSGQVLQTILTEIGALPQELYVTNVVKHRPPRNRNPTNQEISACSPFLIQQIDAVKPKLIICVGKIAAGALAKLAGVTLPMWGLRGKSFTLSERETEVRVTWHPAYVMEGRTPHKRPELVQDLRTALNDARRL